MSDDFDKKNENKRPSIFKEDDNNLEKSKLGSSTKVRRVSKINSLKYNFGPEIIEYVKENTKNDVNLNNVDEDKEDEHSKIQKVVSRFSTNKLVYNKDYVKDHSPVKKENSINTSNYHENLKFSIKEMGKILLKDNFIILLSSISIFIIHLFNLILLNYTDKNIFYTTCYQIGIIYVNVFGGNFLKGSIDSLGNSVNFAIINNEFDKINEFYHETRIYSILFYFLIILPFGFTSNFLLKCFPFMDLETIEASSIFIKIFIFAFLMNKFSEINSIFLSTLDFKLLSLGINLTTLIIHLITSVIGLYFFNLGVLGIAISSLVSSFFKLLISQILVWLLNPCHEKSTLEFQPDILNNPNFYYCFKNSYVLGFTSLIKYFFYEIFGFLCLFLTKEAFIASVLMLNIISFLFEVIVSVTSNFEKILNNYILKSLKNVSDPELSLFIHDNDKIKKILEKIDENMNHLELTKKIISEEKYEKVYDKFEDYFQDINYKNSEALLKGILYFCILLCLLCSVILFCIKFFIISIFTTDANVSNILDRLISFYCIILFLDWMTQVYSSLIDSYTSIHYLTIIRGLFGVFIFIPFGAILSSFASLGIYGYWISFYTYITFFFVVYMIFFNKLDLKHKSEDLRRKIVLRKKTKIDEIENYYKLEV